MTIRALLEPASTTSMPGTTVPVTLRLHNPDATTQVVTVRPSGSLAEFTAIDATSVTVEPGAWAEVGAVITIPASLRPGHHVSEIAVAIGDHDVSTAEATVDVATFAAFSAGIGPRTSKSASKGRHRVTVVNAGNVPIDVTLSAAAGDPSITIEPAVALMSVAAGESSTVDVAAVPLESFWNGAPVRHDFVITATGSDDETVELEGTYEQRPRLRSWWGPALAGALAALTIGAVIWFAVLAPWIQSTADDTAEDANAADREALDAKIEELDAAAAEARELPLGTPADVRLAVEAAPGATEADSFRVGTSMVWSITDIIFQNPTGAAGQVALLRDGDVVLESELANFRDLDFHLVAPLVFGEGSTIELEVTCDAPGPGQDSCTIGTTLAGFTDEAD
jgi:hypothetical protein